MLKWFGITLLLSFSWRTALGQAPALHIFTSPDGTFRLVYPQTYDLLIGERVLKGTQGRHVGIPVGDFSTALACVIYPVESPDETNFRSGRLFGGHGFGRECRIRLSDLWRSTTIPERAR